MNYAYMEMQLTGRYKEVFSRAQMYWSMRNIDADFAEERMSDLYDLLVTAQAENRPVERLTGADDDEFCRGFFGDYTLRERFMSLPKRFYSIAMFILIFELLELFGKSDKVSFFSADTNAMPWIIGIGVGVLLDIVGIFVLFPLSQRFRKVKNESWSFIFLAVFLGLIIGSVTLSDKLGLELIVPSAPVIVAAAGYSAVYLVIRSLWRYTVYGTVFDEQKRMRKKAYSMKKMLSDGDLGRDVEMKVIKTWQQRCEKYISKGKYTEETCIEKFRKDERFNDILEPVTNGIMVLIWLCSVLVTAKDSGIADVLIFAAIIGVILFLWTRFINNVQRSGAVMRKRLISECEKSGKTMPEFLSEKYEKLGNNNE